MTNKTKIEEKVSSTIAKESNGNIQITFTIPFSVIKKAQDETVAEMAKDMEIPGFRKGNAPLAKVKEKISQSHLVEHSLSHVLPMALADAIEANKLKLALYPRFELISAKEGEAWQIRGLSCELPEITLGDYRKAVEGTLRASNLWTPDNNASKQKEVKPEEREQAVIKALLETVKVDIPQILIEEEANSRLSSLLERLEKLGLALESYLASIGKKAEDLKAEYAQQAKNAIALDLVLSKIAEAENIKVSDAEIAEALNISEASNTIKKDDADLEQRKRLLESILKRRQALNLLTKLS